VLESGEVIDADVVGDRHIVGSVRGCLDEGLRTAPVFVRGVGEEDVGDDFFGDSPVEEAAGFAGESVSG
jgi:hypothetical protein